MSAKISMARKSRKIETREYEEGIRRGYFEESKKSWRAKRVDAEEEGERRRAKLYRRAMEAAPTWFKKIRPGEKRTLAPWSKEQEEKIKKDRKEGGWRGGGGEGTSVVNQVGE